MLKINTLELENVKRIKAVAMTPAASGLTVIGGDNNQGKTSVLDAIAWALGGDNYKPSHPAREGSLTPPNLRVTLSNGLLVERKGKNGSLKVTDPTGQKAGQSLLNSFISTLALDLPKFLAASSKQKADILLKIIGLDKEVNILETQSAGLYNQRREIGIIADQKTKHAAELIEYPEAPQEPVSAMELIQRQQAILAKNGENERLRQNLERLKGERGQYVAKINALTNDLNHLKEVLCGIEDNILTGEKTVDQLQDESTAELEASIAGIDQINVKVRSNQAKAQATQEAADLKSQYNELTRQLNDLQHKKTDLLNGANLPLPELSVDKGELIYKGQPWDGMSASEQLKVSTAIIRQLNPSCGFVLVDKLEQMDATTLADFGTWAAAQDLQIIGTRVSKGDECSVIIDDGYIAANKPQEPATEPQFTKGGF